VAQGKFPKPLTLSPTIKVWRNQSLIDWIDFQVENSSVSADYPSKSQLVGEI
jgi:predicted DNA-binding transcriptional regulator AlpA